MRNLFLMNADGRNRRQLTTYGGISQQSVSPDGRYVFHIRGDNERAAHAVWRVDIDGRNPLPLTDGFKHRWPVGSPDGRWVIYLDEQPDKTTLWRVPVAGGKSEQLTTKETRAPVISPDGKWIACFYQAEEKAPLKLALLPFDGGPPAKTFDLPATAPTNVSGHQLRWLPDGTALTYKNKVGNGMTLWQQPVDGSPASQIADLKVEQMLGYDWSRDGHLAYCTYQIDRRVVLIRDGGR